MLSNRNRLRLAGPGTVEAVPRHVPRAIVALTRDADEHGDVWIAALECGHRRHVRHRPPQSSYPWLMTEAGRAAKLGAALECTRCAALELPEGASED
jgi:hypothetical protein